MFKLLDSYRLLDSPDYLAWNAQGNKLVVGSWPERRGLGQKGYDAFAAVLELKEGRLRKTHQFKLNPSAKGGDVAAFSPDDRYIAVGNTTVELFDLQENRSVWVTEHGVVEANRNILPQGHLALAFSGRDRLFSLGEGQLADGKNTALFWGEFRLTDGAYTVQQKTLGSVK